MALAIKILAALVLLIVLLVVADYGKYNDADRTRRSAKDWADSLKVLQYTEKDLQYLIEQRLDTTQNK